MRSLFRWLFRLLIFAGIVAGLTGTAHHFFPHLPSLALSHVTQFWRGASTHGRLAIVVLGGLAVLLFGPLGWMAGKYFGRTELREVEADNLKLRRERDGLLKELQAANSAAAEAEKRSRQAETISRALQEQHQAAVMVSDSRGRTLKKLRHEIAELQGQLPRQKDGDIVRPLARERHGSTTREPRTGP